MIYKDIEWKNYKGVLLPVVPQHQSVFLTKEEQKELLKLSGVHLIRYINNWDKNEETNYWYVIKDTFGGFDELKSNMRNQVRKGLKECVVKRIDFEFLINNGYGIFKNAFIHYRTRDKSLNIPNQKQFSETYNNKSEFWGVFTSDNNEFIAFAENVIRDNGVIYGSMKFDPAYLKLYPSYALIYTMNKYYLEDLGMKYVSDGPRALSHETQIQDMLLRKFNFRKAYCNLNLVLSPIIGLIVNLIYPFRKIIFNINQKHLKQLAVVLKMVEIINKDGK